MAVALLSPSLLNIVPAGAVGGVSNVTVKFGSGAASSSQANAQIEYQVGFSVTLAISATAADTIKLDSSTGAPGTVYPSSAGVYHITDTTTSASSVVTGPVVLSTAFDTVTIPLAGTGLTIAPLDHVLVTIGAGGGGPTNPRAASTTDSMRVSTSKDTTPATSPNYTITAANLDDAHSTVGASPPTVAADGTSHSTVTVTLHDQFDNPEIGDTVTLAKSGGQASIGAASGASNSSGQVTFAVTDGTVEAVTFTATDVTAGNTVLSSTAQVTFTAASDGSGTASVLPTSVTAGGSGGVYTVTYDPTTGLKNGSLSVTIPAGWSAPSSVGTDPGFTTASAGTVGISGQVVTLTAITSPAGTSITIVYGSKASGGPGATAQNASGVATFTVEEETTTPGALTALTTGSPVVTVNPGPVSASVSTAAASATSIAADGSTTSTITVTLTDALGNPVAGKAVSLTAGSGSSTISAPSGTSSGGGVVTFTVKDQFAQAVTYTAKDTTDNVTLTQQPTVTFTSQADGSGAGNISPTAITAGATGGTYSITYKVVDGIMGGKVQVTIPAGWSAPSSLGTDPGFTTVSTGSAGIVGQVITVSGVTLPAGGTLTITYGDKGSGGPGANAQTASGTAHFLMSEASSSGGTLTALVSGSPSVTLNVGPVSASHSTVAPSPVAVPADGTTTSTVIVTLLDANNNPVAGKTVTLAQGTGSSVISAASGPSDSNGHVTFTVKDVHAEGVDYSATDSTDSLLITATAHVDFTTPADGSGTAGVAPSSVTAGSTGNTLTFTYHPAAGLNGGSVTITVPVGWSPPSTTSGAAGFTTTSTAGATVAVLGQVITVSPVTIPANGSVVVVYGDRTGGGLGAVAQTAAGTATFTMQEKSAAAGTLTTLVAGSPMVTVNPAAVSASNSTVMASPSSQTADGVATSTVTVTLLDAFSNPVSGKAVSLVAGSGSSVIGAASGPSSGSGVVTFSVTDTHAEGPLTYTAKDTTDNTTLTHSAAITFVAGAVSGAASTAAASPISVPADGSTASTVTVSLLDATHNPVSGKAVSLTAGSGSSVVGAPSGLSDASGHVTFSVTDTTVEGPITYTAKDTTDNVSVVPQPQITFVPATPSAANSTVSRTTASVLADGVASSTVTVTLRDALNHLVPGRTVTLSPGASASMVSPASQVSDSNGVATFTVTDKHAETATYTATDTTDSVVVTQTASVTYTPDVDGSGAVAISPTASAAGSTGTFAITYTPTAGMSTGVVTVVIPAGWTAPSTTAANAGDTTASTGTVGISAQTVTVSSLVLAAGQKLTITYGNTAGGGSGATAQSSVGTATFAMQEKSSSAGTLTAFTPSPTVSVTAGPVSASVSTVTRNPASVPADGTTPSTITVTLLDRFANPVPGKTVTLSQGSGKSVIGNASGPSDASGHVTFAVRDTTAETVTYSATDSTDGTPLSATAAVQFLPGSDGNGTATIAPSPVTVASTGQTFTLTYHPVDGMNAGILRVVVPPGWTAPSTSQIAGGYTTVNTGSLSASGQTITVSALTLAAGGTLTITYGDKSFMGPGVTVPSTAGTDTFVTSQAATSAGTLTALASPPAVILVAGPVSAATSLVAASPSPVTADGVASSTVTVTLRDAHNNAVSGKTVSLSQGNGHSSIGAASGPSDASGHVTFTVTDTHAEAVTYTAKDTTDNVTVTATGSATFVAGSVSGATSTVGANPASGVVANDVATSTITVTLLDAHNNPVSGKAVSLAAGGGSSTISAASGMSKSSGQVTFTVKDTKAEPVTYNAADTTDAVPITATASVTFVAGPVSASVSTVGANPTTVAADGATPSTITVTLLDANSNPVSGKTVTLSQGSGHSTIGPASGASDSNGVVSFAVTDGTIENVTYTAKDTTDNVTITPTVLVHFVLGAVSATNSSAAASPTSLVADGVATSTITVTLRDAGSHPVAGDTVTLSQGSGSSMIGPASGPSNASGVVTFTVKSTKAEQVTYTASDTTASVVITQQPVVTFNPGAVSAAVSTVSANPATVSADGATPSTITVTLLDANSNAVPGKTVTLAQGTGHSTIGAASGTSDGSGVVTFTVTDGTVENVTYTATDSTDGTAITETPVVQFVTGAVSAAHSTVGANPTSLVADGATASTITVTLLDAASHPVAGKTVTLGQGGGHSAVGAASGPSDGNGVVTFSVTDTHAEQVTYTATDTTDGVVVSQQPMVTFNPGAVSAAASTVGAAPTMRVADGTSTATITVTLLDAHGNPVPGKTVTLAQGPGQSVIGSASGPSASNGVVTFTVKDVQAETVTYTATDATDARQITQAASVDFVPGPVSASVSTVGADSDSVPADGTSAATITVTLLDAHSNPVAGKTVSLSASGGSSAIQIGSIHTAARVASGTSSASGVVRFAISDATAEGPITYTATDTTDSVTLLQTASVTFTGVSPGIGYYMVASDGGIFAFGSAAQHFYGSMGGTHLNAPVVGMAAMPDGLGYYLVASDGGIFAFGSAAQHFYGSMGGTHLNQPVVGMAVMPDGLGYYLVARDGGIFAFGSAAQHFYGSTGGTHLNQPVVGMAVMPDGNGYYLVASDGGIFAFGSAASHFYGSMGGTHLNQPVVGMAVMPDGMGYYLVASDGGLFSFGSAVANFFGSMGGTHLNSPVVGMTVID